VVGQINTQEDEVLWSISDDELTMFFFRIAKRHSTGAGGSLHVCRRERVTEPWQAPEELDRHDLHPDGTVTDDGQWLLGAKRRHAQGGEGIWMSRWIRPETGFDDPELLPNPVNKEFGRRNHPCVSPDGLTLLVKTFNPNPGVNWNVSMFERVAVDQPFATEEKLATLNTPDIDIPHFISNDRLLVIKSVKSAEDEGSQEVLVFTRKSTAESFGTGRPLGIPLGDEETSVMYGGFRLADGGHAIYFHGDLPGGAGLGDIWVSRRVRRATVSAAPPPAVAPLDAAAAKDRITPGDGWVDVRKLIDVAVDSPADGIFENPGSYEQGELVLGHRTKLALPLIVQGDYRLRAEFTTWGGPKFLFLECPIANSSPLLVLADSDNEIGYLGAGLQTVDGLRFRDPKNPTLIKEPILVSDQKQVLEVTASSASDQVTIVSTLDGKPMVDWTGSASRLPGIAANARRQLIISNYKGMLKLHALELKMLDGDARLLRPGDASKITRRVGDVESLDSIATGQWIDVFDVSPPEPNEQDSQYDLAPIS
ncbi:MAG: hypothetical protein KDA75_09325, partial [Planctomycetaceae bacterium]|nr:hypothetical protein [Planctomycetaceae bacterium]